MQASVDLLAAAAQQGQPGDDMAARGLLQALVHARRAAVNFPADIHDQAKVATCLQALQVCLGFSRTAAPLLTSTMRF